jgi:hypothetical protein
MTSYVGDLAVAENWRMLLLQYTNADLIDILSNFKSPETQRCVKLSPRYVLSWIYLDRLESGPPLVPPSACHELAMALDLAGGN